MNAAQIDVPKTIDGHTVRDFRAALAGAFADPAFCVVTLSGSASCFCRGMDLAAALDGSGAESTAVEFAACLADIRLAPKPVIALAEGPATGGGVGLAAAADFLIATPAASFGLTELLFGLVPAIVLPFLLERMSASTVRLWGLSGQTWSAAEAHAAGLADIVTESADTAASMNSWVRRLGRAEPAAVAIWKCHTAQVLPFNRESGAAITAGLLRDSKVIDRIRSFVEEEQLPWLKER
jgi:enoyl-CoA hydratase/carnithine racemase